MHEPVLDFMWMALAVLVSAPLLADRRRSEQPGTRANVLRAKAPGWNASGDGVGWMESPQPALSQPGTSNTNDAGLSVRRKS